MACAYVLYSEKNARFYVGSSKDDGAQPRIKGHNAGKVKSSKAFRPWSLIHEEIFPNYTEARKRENFLKSGQGRQWIKERWQSGRMRRS